MPLSLHSHVQMYRVLTSFLLVVLVVVVDDVLVVIAAVVVDFVQYPKVFDSQKLWLNPNTMDIMIPLKILS